MLLAEELLSLTYLSALEVANLGSDFVEGGRDHGQSREIVRVAVSLDNLRGDVRSLEAKTSAYLLLEFGRQVRERADRSGKLTNSETFRSLMEALNVSLRFRIPVRQLESERDWFGMDSVGPADLWRVLEFPGSPLENIREPLKIFGDDVRRLSDEQSLCGVDHIVRSQAVMKPARVGANDFRNRRGECDDVVPNLCLNLLDAFQFEASALPDGLGSLFRDQSGRREGFRSGHLYREPGAKAVVVAPDAAHFGTGVAGNHAFSYLAEITGTEDCKRVREGRPNVLSSVFSEASGQLATEDSCRMTESASLSDVSNIPPTLRGDLLPGKAVDVVEKLSRTICSQSVAGSPSTALRAGFRLRSAGASLRAG